MLNRIVGIVMLRPWVTVIFCLVIVIAASMGLGKIWFSADFEVYFDENDPNLEAYHNLQDTYTKDDNILFIIAPKSGDIFSVKNLSLLKNITKKAWMLPYSTRVDSLANFQNTSVVNDDLVISDLIPEIINITDEVVKYVRDIALNEPTLVGRSVSPSGHVAGINVTVRLADDNRQNTLAEVAEAARLLAKSIVQLDPDIKVYVAGGIMMDQTFAEATLGDMATLTPLMYLVVLILLAVILRSIKATLITMLVILLATLATMGTVGWIGIALSPPTGAATTIIMTLAVAGCVHLLTTFLANVSEKVTKTDAMRYSFIENIKPIAICSATTAIGFLSFNFSESPPFRDLGNIVAIGIVWTFILFVTLLPALVSVLPGTYTNHRGQRYILHGIGPFVNNHRRAILITMSLVLISSTLFITKNELNDEYISYFSEKVEFRKAAEFASNNLSGTYTIEYSLPAGKTGRISDPEYLKVVDKFASWYRQQPEVQYVATLTDTIKRLNRDMHDGSDAWYVLPNEPDLAAQYLLLFELSLPAGLDLKSQIDIDKSASRFTVILKNLSSKQILDIETRADNWLQNNAPAEMHVKATGPSIMFAHIGMTNIRSMLIGTAVALVSISLILILAFRSVPLGLLSLLPNLAPLLIAFGIWGMFDGQITLSIAVVSGMSLGIIVDDTIHFLSKYLQGRKNQNLSKENAVIFAFERVGFALMTTTVVLAAGFFVMTLSNYEVNYSMALLTIVTLLVALIIDFMFLPALLVLSRHKTVSKPDALATSNNYRGLSNESLRTR